MYSPNEWPAISATIFYYDSEYSVQTAERILQLLEKYGFFPPERLYLGKLTKGRYKKYTDDMRDKFVETCSTSRELTVGAVSGDSRKTREIWLFDWGFTYDKCRPEHNESKRKFWNIMSMELSHALIENEAVYANFLGFFKEAVEELKPFIAHIEDIHNHLRLKKNAGEGGFKPSYIQQVYWGNYLGAEYCKLYGEDKLMGIPAHSIERIGDGVFFTLSEEALDFDSAECNSRRSLIWDYLGLNEKRQLPDC